MKKHALLTWSIAPVLLACATSSQAVTLLSETFDNVNGPFYYSACDPYNSCYHTIRAGVPTTTNMVPADATGPVTGADNNWYAGVFEHDDNGYVDTDVGVQEIGGNGNNTHVGMVKDDSGLLIKLDTTGLTNVKLSFDWRTFKANNPDRFVAGYFVGDLTAGKTNGFNPYREINLSPTFNASTAAGGARMVPGTGVRLMAEPQMVSGMSCCEPV